MKFAICQVFPDSHILFFSKYQHTMIQTSCRLLLGISIYRFCVHLYQNWLNYNHVVFIYLPRRKGPHICAVDYHKYGDFTCVLLQQYHLKQFISGAIENKLEQSALILCAFEPSATKLQRP